MLINYKKIGDTLTDSELNAYASLLAHNKVLKDSFKLKNGVITGNYGKYTFDLTNASIVDNGILITDETLSNNITVKLSNATQYATYTLHFTVIRYGDVNILDETTDNIETFDLTVDLITDTIVNIPLDSLQEYDVILFNSNITIQHNKPEIQGAYITALHITTNKPIIESGNTSTITITATDLQTLPVSNKKIKLLKNNVLLDTLTTDNNGQCSYTYTGVGDGLLNFQAKYQSLTNNTEITDCLFYNNHEEWYNPSSRITVTENTDGSTTLTNNSGSQGFYLANYPNTPKTNTSELLDWDSPLIIEFTILNTNNGVIQLYDGTTTTELTELTEGTILIKFLNNKIEYYTDGELIKTDTNTLNTSRIGFRLPNNSTLTYKDFKIYPIGDT